MAAKFGTSGLRGLVEELIGPVAHDHARAFIRHLKAKRLAKKGDPIFIGLDFRASSPVLREDVAQALALEGMREVYLGAVPTPALAFEAMAKKSAAIMITGSHIPADRNGIKFYTPDGEITKSDEKAIIALVKKSPVGKIVPGKSHNGNVTGFVERYRKAFWGRPLTGMRVGVYQHSTVARDMLVELLSGAGAVAIPLARSDVFVG
jgi:phosphomannomutase